MTLRRIRSVVLALGVAAAPALVGASSQAAPATASPEAQAFNEAFASFKQSVQEFEGLRGEYQSASEPRREAINAELKTYYSTMKEKVDAMVSAALAAYQSAPNEDPKVTELLVSVAAQDVRGVGPNSQGADNYERAAEVIKALVDGGLAEREKRLPVWGFIAAFATNEYDEAEKYYQMAEESGALSEPPPPSDRIGGEVQGLADQLYSLMGKYRELWDKEQAIRAAEAAKDDLPRVKLQTSKGEIVIELFENEAPEAVANFVTLVKDGFYNGVVFHRVLPRFMAQGGDPTGTGTGGPGYSIRCECYEPDARMHFRGSLSMAHAGRDTGGSQFFLTFLPTDHLNGRHTVFGRVIEGWEVLAELQRIDPGEGGVEPDKIVKATVLRDRGHEYTFKKLPAR